LATTLTPFSKIIVWLATVQNIGKTFQSVPILGTITVSALCAIAVLNAVVASVALNPYFEASTLEALIWFEYVSRNKNRIEKNKFNFLKKDIDMGHLLNLRG
jgi:hypothetical protein